MSHLLRLALATLGLAGCARQPGSPSPFGAGAAVMHCDPQPATSPLSALGCSHGDF